MEKITLYNKNIEIINNFFPEEEYKRIDDTKFFKTEGNSLIPQTKKFLEVNSKNVLDGYELFQKKLGDEFSIISEMRLDRMYINCFAPSENPYFHTDGETGYTFLYYPQENWKIDDGGETHFLIDESIYGVFPLPNRIVKFDASILHRATSFRDRHRFTVAIKYY